VPLSLWAADNPLEAAVELRQGPVIQAPYAACESVFPNPVGSRREPRRQKSAAVSDPAVKGAAENSRIMGVPETFGNQLCTSWLRARHERKSSVGALGGKARK
jgi:hypothetical protein